ncbi:hypothetical protein C2S51_014775 [Perilla frutescens var. frutescens]|nr:hypothetical protein C2S51_014775 [Perilla frutescens var. frutescens]
MAYAALVSLANTIDRNLNNLFSIPFEEKQRIISLSEYVTPFQAFLEKFPDKFTSLEGRMREVANDAEDIIEYLVLEKVFLISEDESGCHTSGKHELQLEKVIEEIDLIACEVKKIEDSSSSNTFNNMVLIPLLSMQLSNLDKWKVSTTGNSILGSPYSSTQGDNSQPKPNQVVASRDWSDPGRASQWFQNLALKDIDISWEQFLDVVSARFEEISDAKIIAEFNKLKHVGSYTKYVDKFEELRACMLMLNKGQFSEEYFIASFISGLGEEIQPLIHMFKPATLKHTIELGQQQILNLEAMAKKFKSSTKSNYMGARREVINNSYNSRTSPAPTKPPFKFLTAAEMAARREKGLCYNCDEAFSVGHRCKAIISYMIMSEEGEMAHLQSISTGEEASDMTTADVAMDEIQMALNIISGEGGFTTMRVYGQVGSHKLHILIDSGSTLNFIRKATTRELGCQLEPTRPLLVKVANGNRMVSSTRVNGFQWTMQGHQFTYSPRTLSTEGCDLILRGDWLKACTPIELDYDKMTFTVLGRSAQPSETLPAHDDDGIFIFQPGTVLAGRVISRGATKIEQKSIIWDKLKLDMIIWEDSKFLARAFGKTDPCRQGSLKGRVSQHYSEERILSNLVKSLKEFDTGRLGEIDEDKVHKILTGRRYLVVMDDIWTSGAWDVVRMVFPDNGNGSRIMLTTRLSDMASYPDPSSRLCTMSLMDENQSWSLLKKKVFKDEDCPSELENIGKEITRSCKGLPLAIVVIAGLVSTVSKNPSSWQEIAENVKSAETAEQEQIEEIVSLSYTHLPQYLRPCFLYMSSFPEDEEIRVTRLIRLWIAEGFMKPPIDSKCFEKVGEECLEELVKRNLVLVRKRTFDGRRIKSCLHDLMRDLCIRKAHESKLFLNLMENQIEKKSFTESMQNQRRDVEKVEFVGLELAWNDLAIVGSLPNLQVLKLKDDACVGSTWETIEGVFLRLEVLNLKGIPNDIGEILTLELVEVKGNVRKSLVESAEEIQREHEELGNNTLQVLGINPNESTTMVVSSKWKTGLVTYNNSSQIQLNCSSNTVLADDFRVLSITKDTILVNLPVACSRPVETLGRLFTQNYAPNSLNAVLLQNCSGGSTECMIGTSSLTAELQLDCGTKNYNTSCYSETDHRSSFIDYEKLRWSGCQTLYSAISIESSEVSPSVSLDLQIVRLGWWILGEYCSCSENAICTRVSTPLEGRPLAYRCQCLDGFVGDGFMDGVGCRKGWL